MPERDEIPEPPEVAGRPRPDGPLAQAIYKDPSLLLTSDVTHNGWETGVANAKAFYVRGFTWFKRDVLRNITELKQYSDRYESFVDAKTNWKSVYGEEIGQKLGWRQAYEASLTNKRSEKNSTAVRFPKASAVILLCDLIARDRGIDHNLVYDHMVVQPGLLLYTWFYKGIS
jgi:hypothetical protein